MNQLKLFLLMMFLAGAGGVLGSIAGNAFGRGGLITGGVVGGCLFVLAAGYLAARWSWIRPGQRIWAVAGGEFGFLLAVMVALSTLSSPVGPVLSTLLVGTGAVLGALVGRSAHGEP